MTAAAAPRSFTHAGCPTLDVDAIPAELRAGKRFVAWRYEQRDGQKPAKMPYSPDAPRGASSATSSHWATFDQAVRYAEVAGLAGVMRAFDPSDGLVGIDLDHCRNQDTGELAAWAADIVARLDTYTEVSPSGTGVKAWARGTLPPRGRKRGDVELYAEKRFFTLTGRKLDSAPGTVAYRPDAIAAIHRQVFGDVPDPATTTPADRDAPVPALELGDDEVLRLASESPRNGERFRRLWDGDTGDYAVDGNEGRSEADAALCEILAYYGGPDPERIDRLYRRSGLMRPKWERADYRERTIGLVLTGKTRFYGDDLRPPPTAPAACSCTCCAHVEGPELGRLRRLVMDRDDVIEAQRAIIGKERSQGAELLAERGALLEALASDTLSGAEKGVAIVLAIKSHAQRGLGADEASLSLAAIAAVTGASTDTVSKVGRRLSADEAAPFSWTVTRRPDDSGGWTSALAVRPRGETLTDTFRSIARCRPDRPKHGGAREIGCRRHPTADVVVTSTRRCSACHEVLDERSTTAPALKPHLAVSDTAPPPTVSVPSFKPQDAVSETAPLVAAAPARGTVAPAVIIPRLDDHRGRESALADGDHLRLDPSEPWCAIHPFLSWPEQQAGRCLRCRPEQPGNGRVDRYIF